jgi:hypothetical protein
LSQNTKAEALSMRQTSMRNESFDLFCPKCVIQTEARVIAVGEGELRSEAIASLEEADAEYRGILFYVALCRRCSAPFLVCQSFHGVASEFETVTSEEVLYPSNSRLPLGSVPNAARHAYEQGLRCFGAACFDASALMCRRAIEAVCMELGASSGSLRSKLDKLHENGAIDARLSQWAHEVRVVGNEAAHGVTAELTKDDARDALDFTEAILLYAFELSARFSQFKARRTKNAP